MSLIVVGTVALDGLETPFGKVDKTIGGSGTFGALSASYFTQNTKIVAVIGGDFPKESITMMQEKGIQTEGLQVKENEKIIFLEGKISYGSQFQRYFGD